MTGSPIHADRSDRFEVSEPHPGERPTADPEIASSAAGRSGLVGSEGNRLKTFFRSACAACGKVRVPPGDVKLLVGAAGGEVRYEFRCPKCSTEVSAVATRATAEMLQGLGAVVSLAPGPVAPPEAGPDDDG
jgi:hypothetical protein